MIIYGTRSRVATLGHLTMTCRLCGQTAAHALRRVKRFFTLFFIPVIPFSTKNYVVCASCGKASAVDKEETERMLAHLDATRAAAAQPPSAAPPAGTPPSTPPPAAPPTA